MLGSRIALVIFGDTIIPQDGQSRAHMTRMVIAPDGYNRTASPVESTTPCRRNVCAGDEGGVARSAPRVDHRWGVSHNRHRT